MSGSAGSCTATAAEGELQGYYCKDEHQHGHVYGADDAPAAEPDLAAPAQSLEGTPEAVGHVEPDGNEPHEVEHGVDRTAEGEGHEAVAVGGTFDFVDEGHAAVHEFGKHHVVPEVVEVQQQAEHDDDEGSG